MKYLILLLFSLNTWANLPPTSTQDSSVAGYKTTFKFNFPNQPISYSGTIATLGTLAIAGGGTGQITKAAAFDALSPMSASGDVIYGGTSGTGTRLAKGSDGQYLKLASGLPSWAAAPVTSLSITATKTANYTVTVPDNMVPVNASGGTFTVTLYTAVGNAGAIVKIKKVVADTTYTAVTIATTSAQTIGGCTSYPLTNGELEVVSDGANWLILKEKVDTIALVTGAGATYTANNPIKWSVTVKDTDAAYDSSTGKYTVPVCKGGFYFIQAFAQTDASAAVLYSYLNAVRQDPWMGYGTATGFIGGSTMVFAAAGDLIDVRYNASWTVASSGTGFSIHRLNK